MARLASAGGGDVLRALGPGIYLAAGAGILALVAIRGTHGRA